MKTARAHSKISTMFLFFDVFRSFFLQEEFLLTVAVSFSVHFFSAMFVFELAVFRIERAFLQRSKFQSKSRSKFFQSSSLFAPENLVKISQKLELVKIAKFLKFGQK